MIGADFPKTEQAFHERFSHEDACREYVSGVRWPNGFVCPHCGNKGGWRRKNREEWVCSAKECGKETSLRAGTVFHKSHKPLREWLLAILHMTVSKQGMSALELQRRLGFGSYRTALRWLRELRRAMGHALSEREPLGPEVELDEVDLGGVDEGSGTPMGERRVWVVGAVERLPSGCGRARLRLLKARNGETVLGFLTQAVKSGSLVATDDAAYYSGISAKGYFHDARAMSNNRVKNTARSGEILAAAHLPRIHRVFSLVKRVVIGAHQGSFSREHLQAYLDEYCFRFEGRNRRTRFALFHELLEGALKVRCVPYWRSSGRVAPDVPTKRTTRVWGEFGALVRGGDGG